MRHCLSNKPQSWLVAAYYLASCLARMSESMWGIWEQCGWRHAKKQVGSDNVVASVGCIYVVEAVEGRERHASLNRKDTTAEDVEAIVVPAALANSGGFSCDAAVQGERCCSCFFVYHLGCWSCGVQVFTAGGTIVVLEVGSWVWFLLDLGSRTWSKKNKLNSYELWTILRKCLPRLLSYHIYIYYILYYIYIYIPSITQ